jgi:hypothetical protein
MAFAVVGAASIEVVLLLGLYLTIQRESSILMRLTGLCLYLGFVTVSVYGSFVALNAMMALPDRRAETSRQVCSLFSAFDETGAAFAASRRGLIQGEVSRLREALHAEDAFGFVSSQGKGKNAMYATLKAILGNWEQMDRRADWGARMTELKCSSIEDCKYDPDCCEKSADCRIQALARFPSTAELRRKLDEEYGLLRMTKHGAVFQPPDIRDESPQKPRIDLPRAATKKELVDAAWQELRAGTRPETTRSFAFAVLIDLAIFVLGLLQVLIAPSKKGSKIDGDAAASEVL